MGLITEKHLPALEGLIPSRLTTCSKDGEPNATVISQVWYVDGDHVALSFQFFNKTRKNIQENPYAVTTVVNPNDMSMYTLDLKFDHSETESEVVAGYATEYNGPMLLMFFLCEYLHLIIASIHFCLFFLGG